MISAIIAKVKASSVVAKLIVAILSVGTVGAIAMPVDDKTTEKNQTSQQTGQLNKQDPVITYKTVEQKKPIKYKVVEKQTNTLPKGEVRIETKGRNGVETTYVKIQYSNGDEVDRKVLKKEITVQPVDEVKLVGTHQASAQSFSTPVRSSASNCDENYSGGCVPVVSYDLDCPDIRFRVRVVGYDKHRFDRDGDGWGCEAY